MCICFDERVPSVCAPPQQNKKYTKLFAALAHTHSQLIAHTHTRTKCRHIMHAI